MKLFGTIIIAFILLITAISCSLSQIENKHFLNRSTHYYNYLQPSFKDYLQVSEKWLRNNRTFISDDQEKELLMNAPFELGEKNNSDKAILLVHGLGDSPYSFSDIAKSLQKQGFYVQVLLLPGHGSKPKDLMLPNYSDWQDIVDHYANLLKVDFDNVWLGGYSTGGNLVTIHAIENNDVDGLMLFAPGFQSKTPILEKFVRVVSLFVDGYDREEINLAKYGTSKIQGAIAYIDSAFKLRELLDSNAITVPTLAVISESDSIVDSNAVKNLFLNHFNHPKNKMVWYGNSGESLDSIQYLSMNLNEERISTGSHMSPLFAPNNPYYGISGERSMCKTKLIKETTYRCNNKNKELWYAAWGYKEEGKKHARLTWNPYYTELEQEMANIAE